MYGLEKAGGCVELGYELWRDRDTLRTTFIQGDLLDRSAARELEGTVDVIHAALFLHTLDGVEGQMDACCRFLDFLKPVPGTLIVGSSIGRREAGAMEGPGGRAVYKHNAQSFQEMWAEVSKRAGREVRVTAELDHMRDLHGRPEGHWVDPLTGTLLWEVELV